MIVVFPFNSVQNVPISGGEVIPENGLFVHRKSTLITFTQQQQQKKFFFPSIEFISDVTFSFAVSIQYRLINETSEQHTYKHFCGGVLLQMFNKTAYVITASHCMTNMYVLYQ